MQPHQDLIVSLFVLFFFKVRELGLISRYKTDDRFKKMCGMLDGLAFLPPDLVPVGLDYIRGQAPTDLDDLIDYFDATYVNGTFRAVSSRVADGALTTTMRRRRPEFPPTVWNVLEATLNNEDRTNNACEGWNSGFKKLVGHSQPSIWKLIDCLQQDQALSEAMLLQISRGEPPTKKTKRATRCLEDRLRNICLDYLEHKQVPALLEAVGNCIRF
ncbi:uncharacterized protein ISCGN_029718 [Ixodes scapularis]